MMLDCLNPQQHAAVTQDSGHTLVLAGAGSGKTRVLTTRMAWLVQTGQASPFSLLAVTFTNKAARELLVRLSSLLPVQTRGLWIGTFHGLCNRLLRTHYKEVGLPQAFQILDTSDQLAAIKRLLKTHHIDDEAYSPREVQRFINHAKEQGQRAKSVVGSNSHQRQMAEIYQWYEAQCQREGTVDFSELLCRSHELLTQNVAIRAHYQKRFEHILVDEFQDTNLLQYQWLRLLAGGGARLFAVGDDDQSIYAFRGANVGNMADFERDYAQGNVIRLEQNYRSYGHILDAANGLIAHNNQRLGKNLWTQQGEGEPVRVVEQPSDGLEAQWVVDEIRALIAEGQSRQNIALLYRSNAQSRVLEHTLFTARIPYKVYGGLRFFERQEIKHALAYLRLIANPHDDTAWLRVVNFPVRGIGARTLEQQTDIARAHDISLWSAVAHVPGKGGANLAKFAGLVNQLTQATEALSLPDTVEHVLQASGLLNYYQSEREGAERIENLKELLTAAAVFEQEEGDEAIEGETFTGLIAFLSHASLEAGDNQAQSGQDAVQLMTVHAAKGLEFDAVLITGLEEGLFPHENSIVDISSLEEERRLMYVAMTRARQRLYISFAQTRMLHGQTRYAMASRFLKEIPQAHLKYLSPHLGRSSANGFRGSYANFGEGRGQLDPFRRMTAQAMTTPLARASTEGIAIGEQHFFIDQTVHHARFGSGVIIGLSGKGKDAQAQIRFQEIGEKTLALGIAKLEITQPNGIPLQKS